MTPFALVNNCSQDTGPKCLTTLPEVVADKLAFQKGLAIVFGVIGAIAVVVLILAAINMATATGDVERIARARKSIIYSLIGLIIALSAEAIVLTVLGKL